MNLAQNFVKRASLQASEREVYGNVGRMHSQYIIFI